MLVKLIKIGSVHSYIEVFKFRGLIEKKVLNFDAYAGIPTQINWGVRPLGLPKSIY